jgi:hypothetical protein
MVEAESSATERRRCVKIMSLESVHESSPNTRTGCLGKIRPPMTGDRSSLSTIWASCPGQICPRPLQSTACEPVDSLLDVRRQPSPRKNFRHFPIRPGTRSTRTPSSTCTVTSVPRVLPFPDDSGRCRVEGPWPSRKARRDRHCTKAAGSGV